MLPIEFIGFSGDCRITGRLTLFGDRLSDMLNDQAQYRLSKVTLQSLADGHEIEVESIVLERVDLVAAIATGPRGADRHRVSLDQVRMQVGAGPYVIAGLLHTPHGEDPVHAVMHRPPMVALTDATIAFTIGAEVQVVDAAAVIVNRESVEWIFPTGDEAEAVPGCAGPPEDRQGRQGLHRGGDVGSLGPPSGGRA